MDLWEETFFMDALRLEKLYRSCVRGAASDCGLTPNETVVLLFLSRHAPQQDTATDIAAARGITKALVARSVDGLHRRAPKLDEHQAKTDSLAPPRARTGAVELDLVCLKLSLHHRRCTAPLLKRAGRGHA